MANPQPTDAHLRIAHSLLEQIMVSGFSKRQLSILLFILRLSWGCGKKEANIPRQSDFEIVGVGKGHIKADLDWLMEAKVIYRNGNFYGFNKDYDQWRVSRARGYKQERVTEMVRLNLQESYRNGNQVTKTGTEKLPKVEQSGYRSGNISTSEMAMAKEKLNKSKESVPSKDGTHKLRISNHPLIAQMQKYLGFPEKTDKDPIPNPAKEAKFIKKMLVRGFTPEDIFACWKSKVDQRGGEFVSMVWTNEDIGKKETTCRRKDITTEYANSGRYKKLGGKHE